MAEQLHYTSAATGLAGRPGFQFVAASPGATVADQQAVAPYLTYRPPPSAPPRPSAAELDRFPVSYSFVREGTTAILIQCRYLGTDYSGRYGNFLGHAVVASLAELDRLRPITLWGSPIWAAAPAPAAEPPLATLAELPPGAGTDRDSLAGWLSAQGDSVAGAAGLLAELVEAVLATLDGRAGQVILVADEVTTVARWTAAVSHSLPLAAAQRLSFVTYTGDAARARQHLVGTVTDAWTGAAGHAQVFRLDQPAAAPGRRRAAGRYAAELADAWRHGDLYRIDVLNNLVSAVSGGGAGGGDRDTVAGLARLCAGDQLDPPHRAAVADLLTRHPDGLPEWVWQDLTSVVAAPAGRSGLGLELALAIHAAARRTGHASLADQAGAEAVRLAIGRPADRPRLAGVRLSDATGTAARAVAGAVAEAMLSSTDLDDLGRAVRETQRLGIAVSTDGLYAATARAVAIGGRVDELLDAVTDLATGDRSSAGARQAVLRGIVDGLARTDDRRVGQVLTDEVCRLFPRQDWTGAPRIGAHVLAVRGRRDPGEREAAVAELTGLADRGLLADHELGRHLHEMWRFAVPGPQACLRLLSGVDDLRQARQRGVVELARRAFGKADLTSPAAFDLADGLCRLPGADPSDPAIADATAVRALQRIAANDMSAYAVLGDVQQRAHAEVFQRVMAAVAAVGPASLATAGPELQASVLAALPPGSDLPDRLVDAILRWHDADDERSQLDLAHLTVLLWTDGQPDKRLIAQLDKLAKPEIERRLRAELARRDPGLRKAFEHMLEEHRRRGLRKVWRRRVRS